MLLLADSYYDAFDFVRAVADTQARFVMRSTRKRRPTLREALPRRLIPDHHLQPCLYRPGWGYERLEVRMVEAWITATLADGTRRTELWRLLTNLLDPDHYPAMDLLELCHRRWQAEPCYFSLKSTILDGRVLRSRSVPGLEHEIYALLTTYQSLVRAAGDIATASPGLSAQRVSFVVLFQAAADQIVAARGLGTVGPATLIGAIGRAVLDNLLPERRRRRVKARYCKTASKYGFKRGDHPRAVQAYELDIQVITDGHLDNGAAT
jgi:hypothetical protein